MSKKKPKAKPPKKPEPCQRGTRGCLGPGTPELHSCPYDAEINDDPDSECNCCDHCTQECSDDI